ncbi:MAG: hypothetical protein AMJ54_05730 [Deltaproteobacteria bacterium SG8_13]|nr:MAG: hypothetical protein AMJ54_05730 [Deltaproteobacteria bacterium SG8_13]
MSKRKDVIIDDLKKESRKTIAFFESLQPDQLHLQVYHNEPHWTVRQVLAHFITIERSMQWLFLNILEGGGGTPEDFDLDRYNRTQPVKLDGFSLEDLIARFTAVRRETIAIVDGLEDADLDRQGRHAFFGHGRLERFISWASEHERRHKEDVRKALSGIRVD